MAALLLLPTLVHLGLWQLHKAEMARALQRRYDELAKAPPLAVNSYRLAAAELGQRRVALRGHFESAYQVLLDNQMHGDQAGYLVLTPLRLAGSGVRVLVNRGWVPVGRSRAHLPPIEPPGEEVMVSGSAWQPASPKLMLAEPDGAAWRTVRENFDLARYQAQVPFVLPPYLVRLDPAMAGCYVCDWPRPDERVGMHLGYAMQWFGMAIVLAGFYFYACLERAKGQAR
ncbi:MAG: SURF1 family protein [Sulfuricella sp.]|nr:SURF1 family protein [Sulfuricella sp.]